MIPDTASLWAGVRRLEDILNRDLQAYSFAPLADLYRTLGLLEDALQVARKGCVIHPDFAAGQMALARAALECSLKSEAKSALEAVVKITPENLDAQRLLADIYTVDGEQAAALRCLGIVNSLEPFLKEPVGVLSVDSEDAMVEELADDDILELTDDLIEDEYFDVVADSPFAAAPERPSLGDVPHRAEPFMLETAPPLYPRDEPLTTAQPVVIDEGEESSAAVVASATIAELYVSQGLPGRGAEVYQDLLRGEPDNIGWQKRLAELSAPEDAVSKTDSSEGLLETLCSWLANIRRIKACRIKSV